MTAAVANHLEKSRVCERGWWTKLADATRRCERMESAEAILVRARELYHDNAREGV